MPIFLSTEVQDVGLHKSEFAIRHVVRFQPFVNRQPTSADMIISSNTAFPEATIVCYNSRFTQVPYVSVQAPSLPAFQAVTLPAILQMMPPVGATDLKTWMAGSAEKLRQSGRHIGPVKKPS